MTPICPNCGKEIESSTGKFCAHCGFPIDDIEIPKDTEDKKKKESYDGPPKMKPLFPIIAVILIVLFWVLVYFGYKANGGEDAEVTSYSLDEPNYELLLPDKDAESESELE